MPPESEHFASHHLAIRSVLSVRQRNKLELNSLTRLFEGFPLGIVITDKEEHCIYQNAAFRGMVGMKVNELSAHWEHLIVRQKDNEAIAAWRQRVIGLGQLHLDIKMQRYGGQVFWACILGIEIQLAKQANICIFMLDDISDRKLTSHTLLLAQQQLYIEKVRSQITLDAVSDAVISVNAKGEITYMNPEAESITGWSRKTAIGKSLGRVFRIVGAESGNPGLNPVDEAMRYNRKIPLQHGHQLFNKQGKEIAIEEAASPVNDHYGAVIGAVLVFRHAIKSIAMINKMTKLAWYDFLTGLPNFALFSERLSQTFAMAERHQRRMAVLFMDMDGFKHINDTLGHLNGDRVLKLVADKLESCVRQSDTVCRRSGDEFLIMLAEIEQAEDAIQVAKQILNALSQHQEHEGGSVNLTASIGISIYPDESGNADQLLLQADKAMYEAKRRGSNRYFYAGSNARG